MKVDLIILGKLVKENKATFKKVAAAQDEQLNVEVPEHIEVTIPNYEPHTNTKIDDSIVKVTRADLEAEKAQAQEKLAVINKALNSLDKE